MRIDNLTNLIYRGKLHLNCANWHSCGGSIPKVIEANVTLDRELLKKKSLPLLKQQQKEM